MREPTAETERTADGADAMASPRAADNPYAAPAPAAPAPSRPSAARSTLGVFATRVVSVPLSLATGFLVAWILGPEGQGEYKFMMLMGSFVLPLATFGFGGAIVYYISSGKYAVRDIFATCLLIGILQGAVDAAVMGGLWSMDWLGQTASEIPLGLMLPILLVLPVQGAVLMLTRVLLGDSCFAINNWITLLTPVLTSSTLLVLVVFARFGVPGAVASVVVTNLLVLAYLLWSCVVHYRPVPRLDTAFAREGLRYGLRAWPTDVAVRANLRLDQFLLGMTANSAALGLYSLAVQISELLWMLPDSLAFVLFNRIAAEKDPAHRVALTGRIHRLLFVAVGLASVAAGVLGYWLIPLVLPKYADSTLPLLLLIPGTIAFTTTKVISKYFAGSGSPGKSSITAVAGAVVGVSLYFVLIPTLGIRGAAVASSASYITMSLVAVWLYRSMIAPTPASLFSLRRDDIRWAIDLLHAALPARWRRPAH